MKLIDYSINKFEQENKEKGNIVIPSSYTVLIMDDELLRIEQERKMETLTQKELASWILEVVEKYLEYFDNREDVKVKKAYDLFNQYKESNISNIEFRKGVLDISKLSKEATTEIGKYATRAFYQAISTLNMRVNAIAASDNCIKIINLLYPNDKDKVRLERLRQINLIDNYKR